MKNPATALMCAMSILLWSPAANAVNIKIWTSNGTSCLTLGLNYVRNLDAVVQQPGGNNTSVTTQSGSNSIPNANINLGLQVGPGPTYGNAATTTPSRAARC
ncbi:MAG: hypothetical protein WD645_02400 [Dehalococcoidia bacterium]